MNTLYVTILVENTARRHGLLAEHGLALWIEAGAQRILFDTGQTGIIRHNATRLGLNLGTADSLVLSHDHYDHTGGLSAIPLSQGSRQAADDETGATGRLAVYAHADACAEKYVHQPDGSSRYAGMPLYARDTLARSTELTLVTAPTHIDDHTCVTGPIPRQTGFEDTGGAFFKDKACEQPDELLDDQALYVHTPGGVVVVLGCAHAGVINTLQYIRAQVHPQPIRAVIGGMHLVNASQTRLDRTVAALRELDIAQLYPLHCTGQKAIQQLTNAFPDRVSICPVGTRISFE